MTAPDRAEALVLGWARVYTRGVLADTGERRRQELASDCFEQRRWGGEVGASPATVATSMVARTLAGMPADLLWRQAQIATVRDRLPNPRGRPMGRWIKDNWWLAIAGVLGVMLTALGIGLPFEDRTVGAAVGGVVIAALGIGMLVGIRLRRRNRRVGSMLIAIGTLPTFPFFWTVVLPLLGLAVLIPAVLDAADADADGPTVGPPDGPRRGPDAPTTLLVAILAALVVVAGVIGVASTAVALVAPALAALIAHLLLRGRVHASVVARVGMTAFVTSILTGLVMMAAIIGSGGEIDLSESSLPGVISTVVGVIGLLGLVAFVASNRELRDRARPA